MRQQQRRYVFGRRSEPEERLILMLDREKMKDIVYWVWLAECCGYGSKYFSKLYSFYKNPADIYNLENDEVMQLDKSIPIFLKDRLCDRDLTKASAICEYCKDKGIEILSFRDVRYPERLRLIIDPPAVLYCRGNVPDFNGKLCIGIVGTRKMSRYGRDGAYRFAYELSSLGVCVVSGLALGVDATAACGALEGGEPTVQVLGCGVDVVYPKAHARLRSAVINGGALISEYPPLESPQRYYFPQRNRIISGISQGVFVAECRIESGAMITANTAFAQGKDIFAFPGKVGEPTAEGPNELLRRGAYAALYTEDVIEKYNSFFNEYNKKETAQKLKVARDTAKGVLEALEKYSVPDKCEENEKINNAPIICAKKKETAEKRESENTAVPVEEPVVERVVPEPLRAPVKTAKDYGLDEVTARVFDAIDCKSPISVDSIVCEGLTTQDVVTSLTVLEIMGLITSLPGGLYIRK